MLVEVIRSALRATSHPKEELTNSLTVAAAFVANSAEDMRLRFIAKCWSSMFALSGTSQLFWHSVASLRGNCHFTDSHAPTPSTLAASDGVSWRVPSVR